MKGAANLEEHVYLIKVVMYGHPTYKIVPTKDGLKKVVAGLKYDYRQGRIDSAEVFKCKPDWKSLGKPHDAVDILTGESSQVVIV